MTGGVASVSVTNCLFDEFDVAFQVRNRLFVARRSIPKPNICQDRLGTNTTKQENLDQ
eukprot:COSAG06_NODE_5856_length_3244_cov_16.197774_3_plen_58_part_00